MFFSQEELNQEIPLQEQQSVVPAQSEEYGNFIVKYVQNMPSPLEEIPGASLYPVSEVYGVLYVPLAQLPPLEINSDSYNTIPKCYTYMDLNALGASGITRLHNHPYLGLKGKGTAVAVIDSGIDYFVTFRNQDRLYLGSVPSRRWRRDGSLWKGVYETGY